MSGNQRMTLGQITQSTMKGKSMQNALNTALNSETPLTMKKQAKENKTASKQKK